MSKNPAQSPAHIFINALYGDKPSAYQILLWDLTTKRSNWFADHEKAASFAAGKKNCYIGVGLSPENFGPMKRCPMAKVIGFPGHFIDIDIAGQAHKKGNLPESMDEAMGIVESFPLEPTIVINSGHGLQAWWLFHDLWLFDSKAEREQAQEHSLRFNYTFKEKLAGGKEIDSVFDLSRILRVPGTINSKQGLPDVPVEIISYNEKNRHSLFDIEKHLIPIDQLPTNAKERSKRKRANAKTGRQTKSGQSQKELPLCTTEQGDLVLDPAAEPPTDKLDIMIDVDPMFAAAWRKQREDLSSASEYDLSLANYAAEANWSDQEIANLLIAWRRRHDQDPSKAMRGDYMLATISIATKDRRRECAAEDIKKANDTQGTVHSNKQIITKARDAIKQCIGIDVEKIIQYDGENPTYEIITKSHGNKTLPTVKHLIDQRLLRERVAEFAGFYMPHFKTDKWVNIANYLLKMVEVVDMGEESTSAGQMSIWVQEYLEDRDPSSLEETADNFNPFKHTDGNWYLYSTHFTEWANMKRGYRGSSRQACVEFKSIGFHRKMFRPYKDGVQKCRRVWRVPSKVVPFSKNALNVIDGEKSLDNGAESKSEKIAVGGEG